MTRVLYLLLMYSGLRALFNELRSYSLPKPRAAIIDGETMQLDGCRPVKICVHARKPSNSLGPERIAGMISIYSVAPDVSRLSYAMLRLTSHFGRGEIEIAFFEEKEQVILFAVRNILRSNLDRWKKNRLLSQLKLADNHDEILALQMIIQSLHERGINTSFASPEDCVSLAVNESLLNPKNRNRTIEALKQRYRRIGNQLATHHPQTPIIEFAFNKE